MSNVNIPKTYDPHKVEEKWYKYWEENNCFTPLEGKDGPYFSMVIPPPNVTGSLHMGHALNNTLQDILARWNRMRGINTLWLPGTDHAGIATQNVVERELKKEGKTRDDLGREEFIKRVWAWKEQYGDMIIHQLKRLGASCDWSRLRFTMDAGLSRAVREVFVRLYEEGLIYRDNYIVNWCVRCHTALSDIETEYKDVDGYLYYIKYPLKDRNGYVTVATTRPETMLGDTAVAVNPDDIRYKDLHGEYVILPVLQRTIPIICDTFVDIEFGTGVVKVTPAHDPNDFEIGKRYNLPQINILNPDGTMNENAGKYKGLDRYECRKKLVDDLTKQGLIEKIDKYSYSIGHCYRCHTPIEPYISLQWFVKTESLAKAAIDAVEQGKIEFIPKTWEKTYFEWMRNIKDWCISRQIWWGHRIPVWYCQDCNKVIVAREDPDRCTGCGGPLQQDEDVLDTWFSSALWPFSTLGWPDNTSDLAKFYPTSVLSTGFDIIFFWVARMIMMGLKFMGNVPFRKVYIHALIRDAEGQKMSKSKGNVIDPLHIIQEYGTDALRFTLSIMAVQGRDILLSEERIKGYRHFCNKLWNAGRFILMNLDGYIGKKELSQELADTWILSRLNQVIQQTTTALEKFEFAEAAAVLYNFVWHEYCDWYLELVKPRLHTNDRHVVQYLLVSTFECILKLLHPFIPFITEELWQKLPKPTQKNTITLSEWPKVDTSMIIQDSIDGMNIVMEVITAIRNIRAQMNIPLKKQIHTGIIKYFIKEVADVLKRCERYIKLLGNINNIIFDSEADKPHASAVAVVKGAEIYIPLEEIIDIEKERIRLQNNLKEVEAALISVCNKLQNKNFMEKAAPEVIAKVKEQEKILKMNKEKLEQNLKMIEGGN
jgi:valyl-tRNA synthetase